MDSLGVMLDRLRVNDPEFKDKFITITSVYNSPFDSDTIEMYLKEGTLLAVDDDGKYDVEAEKDKDSWVVKIPLIYHDKKKDEWIVPKTVILSPDIEIEFPETIEEFRSMAKAHNIRIQLNTQTFRKLFA